jgi:hypothetical protein
MHTHTYTHVYKYIHIHIYTRLHIYTYLYVRTHAHIHIYHGTHTYKVYICTHASTPGTTAQQQLHEKPDLTPRNSALLLLVRTEIQRGVTRRSEQFSCPIHEERRVSEEQPQLTAVHRTITTARHLDHIYFSALVRSRNVHGYRDSD